MIRYAIVRNARTRSELEAYLPSSFKVIYEGEPEAPTTSTPLFVIEGRDVAGWTLDGYVIPRLASGLIHAQEVGLDDPIMKKVPA